MIVVSSLKTFSRKSIFERARLFFPLESIDVDILCLSIYILPQFRIMDKRRVAYGYCMFGKQILDGWILIDDLLISLFLFFYDE